VWFWGNRSKNGSPYATGPLSCLSVLSVTLVHCGQTLGWIKIKTWHASSPRPWPHCVRRPSSPSPTGAQTTPPPISGPHLLRPKGWMDHDATWYGDRPRPRRLCVGWGPSSPSQKGGGASPIFGPYLLWPNGWMHQDATWYGGRPQPRRLCVRWKPTPLPKKGRSPQFSAHVYCLL